ncbi:MAG TPA: RNA polymerase sigma factor RpoD/SigA [Parafilimonas sp.]|nr:RNA polymerase sigma factor RpoD/SigA [Parafilimonas sp.]
MRSFKISSSITNRETFSLQRYLREVSKLDMISSKEEELLTRRIKKGDQKAIEQLVKANLRFVVSVAKQYQYQGLPLSDLINEGNVGLIKAATRFDETRGFKFISYAVWWIRQNILQAIAENGKLIRLPMNKFNLFARVRSESEQFEQTYEREPSTGELADSLHLEESDINDAMNVSQPHVSVDAQFADSEQTLCDVIVNSNAEMADRALHHESLRTDVQNVLKILSTRQKEILCSLYGIGTEQTLSLDDLGSKYNLSRERVRQIRDKALSKIKSHHTCKYLCCYLTE